MVVVTQGSKTKAAALTISILLSRVSPDPSRHWKKPGCFIQPREYSGSGWHIRIQLQMVIVAEIRVNR